MRVCERKWIEEKKRLREQRAAEFRRRERKRQEEEQRQHRTKEEERRRFAEEQRKASKALSTLRTTARAERKYVNYDHLASKHTPADREQRFVYDYMVTCPSLLAPRQPPIPPPVSLTRPRFPAPTFDESRAVSFKDVLRSMEGRLFSDDEYTHRNASPTNSRSRTSSRRKDLHLLDALLAEVEYTEEDRRKRKGKGQERHHSQRSLVCLACSVCRSPLPSPSSTLSSSSVGSRTSSWLSFRTSSSLSSSCSDLTTLSSPPMTSRKSPWLASRPQSWIPVPCLTDTSLPPSESPLRHSCRAYNRLTTIPLSEAPLVIEASPPSPKSLPMSYEGHQRDASRSRNAKEASLVKRVSRIFELAKNIQSACVTTVLFSVAVSYEDGHENHAFLCARRKYSSTDNSVNRQALGVPGFRASVFDVKIFLTGSIRGEDDTECSTPAKYIPLTSPYPPTEPPRTILPDPLPYHLHFKPIPQTIRSPFHHHAHAEMHTMYPSPVPTQHLSDAVPLSQIPFGQLSWRIRCVGNPAYLRLKAVQNIVWRRGVKWEGCGRDTAMGGGRERVIGVAYEGVGRSNLSYAISTSG